MRAAEFPILEYDPTPTAVVNPSQCLPHIEAPEYAVLCFFSDAIEKLLADMPHHVLYGLKSVMGTWPIYQVRWGGRDVVLANPRVGAPLAAGTLEALIAFGCKKIIVCGGAAVLDQAMSYGQIIVVSSAVRDEGTSYHYLPPSREVEASATAVAAIKAVLGEHDIPYTVGKVWTTDAFYRETIERVALRKREGCLAVEMEAAAMFAVAKFRGVTLGQFLLCGDDVSGSQWDRRGWGQRTDGHEKALSLAFETCLSM
ncbi:MAG: hypothetical protein EHM48_07765 [Planctomycetaceae bacterium]|nr:MAG: hypothetical protein EHM48_07765 [Planctomycetaceae bacterium]